MADLMIDIEGLATGPDTTILTIAAQPFDPFGQGHYDRHFYTRVTLESQEDRKISEATVQWWATQPEPAREEAFGEKDRVPLETALIGLSKIIRTCGRIWAQGPTYDMTILEHAYASRGLPLPWQYYNVRDSRTVFRLWPDLPQPPTSHHALEDCRRQILMLQETLRHFNIKEIG